MPNVICNTSPVQYLYQLDMLHILRSLAGGVIVPPAVVEEIAEGRARGMSLPDLTVFGWVTVRRPVSELAVSLVTNLGPGETEVLMLALESPKNVVREKRAKGFCRNSSKQPWTLLFISLFKQAISFRRIITRALSGPAS